MGTQRSKRKNPGAARKASKAQADHTTRNVLLGVVALIGVVVLGWLLWLGLRPTPELEGVVQFPRPSRGHEVNLDIPFGELPPAGGVHDPVWQTCGVYDAPLNTANVVHSMEHGAVWITYQPDLPADQVAAIQDAVRGQNFIVVSPYPEQRSPVVMTAWGVQLELPGAADERFDSFIERYRVGPNTPERGASCSNGIGEPIG